ncbi:MAG: hypothetical protein EOO92_04125 [Pedobacter sp.]|nr:MAG: hypothetical protein EOO92_04125 [Pedobacter sp.]
MVVNMEMQQQVAALIAAPGRVTQADAAMLKDLVAQYPYFQPLRLLLAKATLESNEGNFNTASAALYTNGQLLHTFLHAPENLLDTNFEIGIAGENTIDIDEPEIIEAATDEQEIFEEIGEVNVNDYQHIVSTDFFAFQDNFRVETVPEIEDHESAEAASQVEVETAADENIVSKYDDDKLPYTFLWWLAKTRKEHQQIFQPYASPREEKTVKEPTTAPEQKQSELQQQYVEHIFHIQTPFNAEELLQTPARDRQPPKGIDIIEKFIKNEPQIRVPKADEINNENKARKSAEDHNDMVTETLAKIYIEQMLYDKAIETYQKLSLKFPEKSRYFADLIQSIEKKI